LLAALKSGDFLGGGALEVHPEPYWPDEEARYASCDVLRNLAALLSTQVRNLLSVGLNLRKDSGAVHVSVLWLNNGNGLRRSASTPGTTS
jgi:hypothetical protein